MTSSLIHYVSLFVIGLVVGLLLSKQVERFSNYNDACDSCGQPSPCGCPAPRANGSKHPAISHPSDDSHPSSKHVTRQELDGLRPECKQPDMNKYVLKSSIPPCPAVPDLSNYILKSECPPVPDLSNYVLKSSIPKQSPVILDCSKCQKAKGECPPCPRPRCPEVQCPAPTKCPGCPPCKRTPCPPATVKCKVEDEVPQSLVRPYLAPLSYRGFGTD